ncbi:MAG: DNA repair protein RadC [Gemmatimonas sp.]|nr:DNA repair protein RadC [Gemmatimonas sp.]
MYRIPIYQVRLVRDGSQPSARKKVVSPSTAARVLQQYLDGADREHFVALLLDTQNQIIGIHTVTIGTLDASLVHPREIFKPAILANAASVILAHNHPSGDPTPSAEDRTVTRQVVAAGTTLGIEVLDHVIVGGPHRYHSFRESGLMESLTG